MEFFNRPLPRNNKFLFFSTGSPDLLLEGIPVDLKMSYTPEQCKADLKRQLQGKIYNIDNYDLLIYLAGGIPFLGGTLNEIYPHDVKPYIYGILTRPISDKDLNAYYNDLCNIAEPAQRILLSPICDSTEKGYCDIACILGYLNHDGFLWEKFLRNCAFVIHFPPFITCLTRIAERNDITGRDVITVTSTLHTYFRYLHKIPKRPNEIFKNALKCCNIIIKINNENDNFPMKCFENENPQFLLNLKQPKTVYFWKDDLNEKYAYCTIKPIDLDKYDEENSFISFKPIAPLSIRVACGCSIVKGKNHSFLYIPQSTQKGAENSNKVDLFDPIEGKVRAYDLEKFAAEQINSSSDKTASLINEDRVKQVIFVCLDQSDSMNKPLDGDEEKMTQETQTRTIIATQYLTIFFNEIYSYRIPCIQGLIKFNNQIIESCPLSPLVSDFEEKGLNNLTPNGGALLWEAISYACDKLVEFTKTSEGNKRFENAVNRILVISDGENVVSEMKIEEVAKKMMQNRIILDSVLLNTEEKCKELVTLCHITGGFAFNPKTINEGLLLFQRSAFLNYEERVENINPIIPSDRKSRPRFLQVRQINEEFIKIATKKANFDTDMNNKIIRNVINQSCLASPQYICAINWNSRIHQPRFRRILEELHYCAMKTDSKSPVYDPNIIVYPSYTSIEIWQVFLKGEDYTPYQGKWFFLNVIFPNLYPIEAPTIRFFWSPYHLNISSNGRICLNIFEESYNTSIHVIDIIQQIRELFVLPSIESSVNIEILDTYINDYDKYNRLAQESAQLYGRDNYKDFLLQRVRINDIVPDNLNIFFDNDHIPAYMSCPISGRAIKNPFFSPSSVHFEKEELKQLVTSNINPVCTISGKPLTESIENLDAI